MKNRIIPIELQTIKEAIGNDINEEYGIYHLDINSFSGSGKATCISFDENITALDLDFRLHTDKEIVLKSSKTNPLYFIYGLNGNCHYKDGKNPSVKLDNLKSIILTDSKSNEQKLIFEKSEQLKLNILVVDKDAYFSKFLNGYYQSNIKLEKLLDSIDSIENNLHLGSYNLKITEQLRKFKIDNRHNDITDFLVTEGIYHLIMAYHIEQFYDDVQRTVRNTSLTDSELRTIGELSEYIVSAPEVQHNIDDLCRRAGMSPAKLQEGFKHFYDKTVLNYIRYVRLQKAETLLLNSDLNISEVVYSIGFTSRSYFCKIFKAKYNCTPKEYRKKIQNKYLQSVA